MKPKKKIQPQVVPDEDDEEEEDIQALVAKANRKQSKKVKKADTGNHAEHSIDSQPFTIEKQADAGSTLSDEVIEIPMQKPKKKKKSKA